MNASAECPISVPLPDGLTLCEDGLVRPTWASHDRLLRDYYDNEWGVPVHDEAGVFERLALEGFQAGLSWRTVLAKRDAIIRNRRKIEAAITNARATLALRDVDEAHSPDAAHLGALVWSYRPDADPHPTCAVEVPTALPESRALAADLKARGFRFVGPTTMLALMAAIGIVNTDIVGTHRRPV